MKPYTRDALTGLTAIAGVLGLSAMLMLFGELRGLTSRYYDMHLRLDSARGLLDGSPVTLNGVRVGKIGQVRNAQDPSRGVEIDVQIEDGVRIPEAFEVHIDKGLIGDATLELTPLADDALAGKFITPGQTVERKALTMMDEIAAELAEPFAAIEKTAANLDTLTTTYDEVGRRVSAMLEPRTPAEVGEGRPANIPSTIARIDSAVASADLWLGDAELRADARSLVDQASGVIAEASGAVQSWRTAGETLDAEVKSVGDEVSETSARVNETLTTLGQTAEEFRIAAHSVNSGQGTLGMLLSNPDLYRSLQSAAERLERALVEAQLLIEKYRKEGVPIQF
jgi:phospholipid/cholesterol/gamma-HCH transport system substrate-binding protein